jgi:hypothetical protein
MAEILLMAINKTHSVPAKDAAGCYKRGDPVIVRDDGHTWGSQEAKAPINGGSFVIIKLPGVPRAKVEKYLASQKDDLEPTRDVRRRLWRVVVDELPAGVRNQLRDTGTYTTTWNQVRNFIENKVTLARETSVE